MTDLTTMNDAAVIRALVSASARSAFDTGPGEHKKHLDMIGACTVELLRRMNQGREDVPGSMTYIARQSIDKLAGKREEG